MFTARPVVLDWSGITERRNTRNTTNAQNT